MGAAREPEIVAGGYEIDMADLPKVHFAEHPEWEELYDAAWESHKSNIRKARAVLNPEEPYYVDEAFSDMIFVWDTLLMMMFDKYGIHQFPTLQAMDNFYYWQVDNPGQPDDGFIAREISEITGERVWTIDIDERHLFSGEKETDIDAKAGKPLAHSHCILTDSVWIQFTGVKKSTCFDPGEYRGAKANDPFFKRYHGHLPFKIRSCLNQRSVSLTHGFIIVCCL